MKLVLAIMEKNDSSIVMDALTEEGFQVTKMASTGGFLKSGNTTLIIGVEDNKTNKVIDIISKYSSKRKQIISNSENNYFNTFNSKSFEITTGGAIIFVLDVNRFEKIRATYCAWLPLSAPLGVWHPAAPLGIFQYH